MELHEPVIVTALAELPRVQGQGRPIVPFAEAAGRPLELHGHFGNGVAIVFFHRGSDVDARVGLELGELLGLDVDLDSRDRFTREECVALIACRRDLGLGCPDHEPKDMWDE